MLFLYNSLTRKKELFKPLSRTQVKVYTCGPTVYDYTTIANWRTYFLGDILLRTLNYLGYKSKYIMNITDVGHLTGDNLGDASIGEDRLEKGAVREGKSAWDIAGFYTNDFLQSYKKLNLTQPKKFTKATDYISQQIDLVQKIVDKGFSYKLDRDGIYFDVQKYEQAGYKYGQLSTLDQRKEGARVINTAKKDGRDFALWKFSPAGGKRQMEWDSPWGKGFPGWHVECSAMCIAELGEQIDIHIGGEDLRSTHHPNEIVQSEVVTGKRPFVRYWLHGAFLLADGGRMGKSLGNAYTLQDIIAKGFDPLALRYLYFTAHYRKQLNFTWEALAGAQKALNRLRLKISKAKSVKPVKNKTVFTKYEQQFKTAIGDNLDMPRALSLAWEAVQDNALELGEKYSLLLNWDKVLGLGLDRAKRVNEPEFVPSEIKALLKQREELRQQKKYQDADVVRKKIEKKNYQIIDTTHGAIVKRK